MKKHQEVENTKLFAKLLTIHGYRNSPIEDIHAGNWPKLPNGEYAPVEDVIVTTKMGGTVVPWAECSRISDSEMKHLNKTIYNQIYTLLTLYMEGTLQKIPNFMSASSGGNWDEPELLPWAQWWRAP